MAEVRVTSLLRSIVEACSVEPQYPSWRAGAGSTTVKHLVKPERQPSAAGSALLQALFGTADGAPQTQSGHPGG
jgi:hypothetical protein